MKEENKVVKLNSCYGAWDSINLNHPSTFDTLAMDPTLKNEVIDDLDRFVKRKDFYRRVGKAWKCWYLLYKPPGTGKSSLIATMANYLKFHIYDLELTSLQSDVELGRFLIYTEINQFWNLMSPPRALSALSLLMSSSAISAVVTSTSVTSFSISVNME
ncbi:AAA-ATPase [Camellia lanceoleosa]|uniref:AAA-ATPase n=1 Tax=Camellia lanceoleosa TaxID=1840588 RepID=A0ACC0IRH3_9ERIC|nr:AAA-ATPase [Camellia lanceoleosa]